MAQPLLNISAVIEVEYGMFELYAAGTEDAVVLAEYAVSLHQIVVPQPGGARFMSAVRSGAVQLDLQVWEEVPGFPPADAWDRVEVAALNLGSNQCFIEAPTLGAQTDVITLLPEVTEYFVRVAVRQRHEAMAAAEQYAVDGFEGEPPPPVEGWQLQFWPRTLDPHC